jgi:DNA-binding MarR family transcriptional regulator
MTHQSDHRAYFFKLDITIKKIRNTLQRRFNEANCDLTVDQWVLFDNIYREPGITQNQLVELTGKDAPTITRIIDLLEKKEFVERQSSVLDKRKFNLFITDKGNSMYKNAAEIVTTVRKKGWGDMKEQDYKQFVRIVDSIYKNFA